MSALRPFNVQRLPEINMLIYEAINSGNKEVYECFQCLIEDVFSTEKDANWNLFTIYSAQNQDEFNHLYKFLNADGDLFNLIKFLMGDASLKYLFPVSKLSVSLNFYILQIYFF